MITLLLACTASPDVDTGEVAGPIALTDAANYTYTIDLEVSEVELLEYSNATIDWSEVTRDLRGRTIDPRADVRAVQLVWLRDIAPDELGVALATGSIEAADVGAFAEGAVTPGQTSATFADLGLLGQPFPYTEYFGGTEGTWMARLAVHEDDNGMVLVVRPTPTGAARCALTSDSASLEVGVDLASTEPVRVPDGETRVRWDTLTRDGLGDAIDSRDVQRLEIARFDESIEAIEAALLDYATLAEASWAVDAWSETEVDLAAATDADGGAFPGFDAEGTWLVALWCDTCPLPAPPFLGRIARP